MGRESAEQGGRRTARRDVSGRLAFRVIGDRPAMGHARPPVVLIHGIGMSHRYLTRLHDALASDRRVFAIDLPGFAGLPKPHSDVGVEAMAGALAQTIRALGVGPVVLVGQSMGTQWVTEVAVQAPELVSHLVLIGPVADARHRSFFAQMRALTVDSLREPLDVNVIVFTDYVRCGVPWYLAQLRHMLAYRPEEKVAAVSAPVLIIRGERDSIAGPAWCRRLRDLAAEAVLVHIPGRAHNAQHSSPAAVASAIRAHTR